MTEDQRFQRAVEFVLQHEGGLVDDPNDPGGITHWGISLRSYPQLGREGIKNLTREQAVAIYRRDWWDRYRYGEIQDNDVAAKVLDLSVHVGPGQAHRIVQRALHACGQRHVTVDGIIGTQTLTAINAVKPRAALLAAIRAEAAAYYRGLVAARPELSRFEKGWLNRAYA